MDLNYAMFAAENSDIDVIKNSLVDVTMAALSKNYGKTGLVSEYKMDNYEQTVRDVKEAMFAFAANKAGIKVPTKKNEVLAFFSNPVAESIFNSIIAETIADVRIRVTSPQLMAMAEIISVEPGDSYTWEIETKALPVVQKASLASNVVYLQSWSKQAITIAPEEYGLGTTMDFIRILAADYDLGKEIARMVYATLMAEYSAVANIIFATSGALATKTPFYKSTWAAADYVKMAEYISALNGGMGVTAYGTLVAFNAVSALATTSFGFAMQDRYIENGYLGKIYGIDSVILDQVVNYNAPLGTSLAGLTGIIPDNLIVLLSAVGDKPVKLVRSTYVRVKRDEPQDGSLNRVVYRYFFGFNAALATQAHFGLQSTSAG
ncbi:MAG: hypothetical protein J6T10_14505 [Methanobrevibacter sp.]|nr:hypothetical protein [Methanobrevibacter sp.]